MGCLRISGCLLEDVGVAGYAVALYAGRRLSGGFKFPNDGTEEVADKAGRFAAGLA